MQTALPPQGGMGAPKGAGCHTESHLDAKREPCLPPRHRYHLGYGIWASVYRMHGLDLGTYKIHNCRDRGPNKCKEELHLP